MKEEILNKLANKIIRHYPDKDNFIMFGSIHQEPYKNHLLLFKEAFNCKNLEHKNFMFWDNFNEELLDKIKKLNPEIYDTIIKEFQFKDIGVYSYISIMWNEWNFILEVIGINKIDQINTEKHYKL